MTNGDLSGVLITSPCVVHELSTRLASLVERFAIALCDGSGWWSSTIVAVLVEGRPLDRRRGHLGKMNERGLVVGGESSGLLVVEREDTELTAVKCRSSMPQATR